MALRGYGIRLKGRKIPDRNTTPIWSIVTAGIISLTLKVRAITTQFYKNADKYRSYFEKQ